MYYFVVVKWKSKHENKTEQKENIPADISITVFHRHGQFSTTVTLFTFVYLHKVCAWSLSTLKLNYYWLISEHILWHVIFPGLYARVKKVFLKPLQTTLKINLDWKHFAPHINIPHSPHANSTPLLRSWQFLPWKEFHEDLKWALSQLMLR